MNHILKDLRIIEGSAFVAAPLAGMTLAQLGADVIRFDPVRGAARSESGVACRRPGTTGAGQIGSRICGAPLRARTGCGTLANAGEELARISHTNFA